IALLASQLLGELSGRYHRPELRLSPEAIVAMESYPWPGNVRQLFNALEYAVVNSDGTTILPRHLLPDVAARIESPPAAPVPLSLTRYYATPLPPDEEHAQIRRMLDACGGNKAEAARRLGMSRTTLWKRLNRA
ncbi:MAG: hypothetical protein AzoDbin1_04852, partial [Azoarcus sp.]|nr:hypothetical protein [Azoarcus sp.]